MDFLERDLEDIVFNAMQSPEGIDHLQERGLDFCHSEDTFLAKRQLKIGNYGVCDIITMSKFDTRIDDALGFMQSLVFIQVCELKRGQIDVKTLIQVKRYIAGVKQYMGMYHPKLKIHVSGLLIGRSLCTDEWVYLIDGIDDVIMQTYSYGIDGIEFKTIRGPYTLVDNGLSKKRPNDIF
jgi:hypothetical protein